MTRSHAGYLLILAFNGSIAGTLLLSTPGGDDRVQPVIRARMIEVVDDNGDMRAQLHIARNGAGELRLRSASGDIRVKLGATDDGAILLMMDRSSEPAIRLTSESAGQIATNR